MGSSLNQSSNLSVLSSNNYSHWVKVGEEIYCDVVVSECGENGQRYHRTTTDFSKDLLICQYRKDNQRYLVAVHSLQLNYHPHICHSQSPISIITERVPYRLSDMGQIQCGQGLYILSQVFHGIQIIYQKCRDVRYDESMICFNDKGQCKIWLNQQIHLNQPANCQYIQQQSLINSVFKLVEERMYGIQYQAYLNHKNKYTINNIQQAIQFITFISKRPQSIKREFYKSNTKFSLGKKNSGQKDNFKILRNTQNHLINKINPEIITRKNKPCVKSKLSSSRMYYDYLQKWLKSQIRTSNIQLAKYNENKKRFIQPCYDQIDQNRQFSNFKFKLNQNIAFALTKSKLKISMKKQYAKFKQCLSVPNKLQKNINQLNKHRIYSPLNLKYSLCKKSRENQSN